MIFPIGLIFGTRPEYLKLLPFFTLLQEKKLPFYIFHIKQHKALDISESILSNYHSIELSDIDGVGRLNELASLIPQKLEKYLSLCKSILVQGDTATAFFSALTAFHLKIPIIHLEAGLRTYDINNPFPEEAYRSMISRIANIHLCPDINSKNNLIKENINSNIYIVGNTILDLVKSYNIPVSVGNSVIITIHRRENWDNIEIILNKVWVLCDKNPHLTFIWILHPNPELQKKCRDYILRLGKKDNFYFEQAKNHKELCKSLSEAHSIITDSGGIQEEASFIGKKSYVIRKFTERNSIPSEYIQLIINPSELDYYFKGDKYSLLPSCKVYGDGNATSYTINILENINISSESYSS